MLGSGFPDFPSHSSLTQLCFPPVPQGGMPAVEHPGINVSSDPSKLSFWEGGHAAFSLLHAWLPLCISASIATAPSEFFHFFLKSFFFFLVLLSLFVSVHSVCLLSQRHIFRPLLLWWRIPWGSPWLDWPFPIKWVRTGNKGIYQMVSFYLKIVNKV